MLQRTLFVLLLTIVSAEAASSGAAALKIGAAARGSAMGEAFTAVADDASALFWNPAGTASLDRRSLQFSYASWIQGIRNQTLSLIVPTPLGAFGLGLILNTVDGFEQRVIASEEPLGVFSANTLVMAVSYAREIIPRLTLGANFKLLHEKIYLESTQGRMIDLGLKWRAPVEGLCLAAALQNWGTTTRMAEERIRLPLTWRAGGAYRLPFAVPKAIIAADYLTIRGEAGRLNMGAEVTPLPYLSLRAGYQTGFEDKGVSLGFGLHVQSAEIDYAYVPFGRGLGYTHRFSVSLPF